MAVRRKRRDSPARTRRRRPCRPDGLESQLVRIAITGGMGFIGQALARRLIAAGHAVVLIDSLAPQIHGEAPSLEVPAGASLRRLDVRDVADEPALLEGCDLVYHL